MTLTTTKPATLRNRVRITNKTRLRVFRNPRDDDIGHGDDIEAARGASIAGVDAEDAKEHHLQAALSAAAARRHVEERPKDATYREPSVVIPVPDYAGLFANYDEFYPSGRFTNTGTYFKLSTTVEENISASLNRGFTYYMDDEDKKWLDAYNTTTPTASHSSSFRARAAKGKVEGSPTASIPISFDEFELLMGLFEMVTEEKAPFLHHNHGGDSAYPPLSAYHEALSTQISPSFFASWVIPAWIPVAVRLLALAEAIFPHWQRRRRARGGHRITPVLNYDESDIKNESYVCFRRRERKAMRKTRIANAASAEKLQCLQRELLSCQELATALCQREALKLQLLQTQRQVWLGRKSVADMLRLSPKSGTKSDEELFIDIEPTPKKRKMSDLKVTSLQASKSGKNRVSQDPKSTVSSSAPAPPIKSITVMPPRERYDLVRHLEDELLRAHSISNEGWEDLTEEAYETSPHSAAENSFALLSPSVEADDDCFQYRAVRLRRGRGGVFRMDRHLSGRQVASARETKLSGPLYNRFASTVTADKHAATITQERRTRLQSQWMFDHDDTSVFSASSRTLINDFDRKYLVARPLLISGSDVRTMTGDFTMTWTDDENRLKTRVPHVFGPDPREQVKANEIMRKAREDWNRAARRAAQISPNFLSSQMHARSRSSSQDTHSTVDSPSRLSAPSAATTPSPTTTPQAPSYSTESTSIASHEATRVRSVHPVRGAIHMPCVPLPSQFDPGAFKRIGFITKPSPSRPPSVTRTPAHPNA